MLQGILTLPCALFVDPHGKPNSLPTLAKKGVRRLHKEQEKMVVPLCRSVAS